MSKGFLCPNCKEYTKDGHYVPPSLGDEGFFVCTYNDKRPRPEKIEVKIGPGHYRMIDNPEPKS